MSQATAPLRIQRLTRAVNPSGASRAPKIRRAMLTLGTVAMSLGVMAIVFGWYGAAHSPYLYQEVPYLISGGLLGVGLLIAGGFLYLSAWIVRLIDAIQKSGASLQRVVDQAGELGSYQ